MTALLVAVGAALGAPLRYAWSHLLDGRLGEGTLRAGHWPRGTLLANAVGSALVGFLAALSLSGQAWALLATGFCGALTSFSAFAVQTVDGSRWPGAVYAGTTVVLATGLCAAGFWVGTLA